MKMKPTPLALLAALTALLLAGCADDPLLPGSSGTSSDGDGLVHFAVRPPATTDIEMLARATVAAQDKEKAIYVLRILVFDKNDQRIPDAVLSYYDKSKSTKASSFATVLKSPDVTTDDNGDITAIPGGARPVDVHEGFSIPCLPYNPLTAEGDGATNYYRYVDPATGAIDSIALNPTECTVWALANIGRWKNSVVRFRSSSSADVNTDAGTILDDEVKTRDDLRRLCGQRLTEGFGSNRDFLPMVGTIPRSPTSLPVVDTGRVIGSNNHDDWFAAGHYPAADYPYGYQSPQPINLTESTSIGQPWTIEMNQIVAKVRFNITMPDIVYVYEDGTESTTQDPNLTLVGTREWRFYFDTWTVKNLPRYTYIIPHQTDIADYLGDARYRAAAGITDDAYARDFAGLYVPTAGDPTEEAAFLHNGEGDGVSVPGQDWVYGGMTCPPDTANVSSADETTYIETDPATGQRYYHFYTYGNRRGGPRTDGPCWANLGGAESSYSGVDPGSYSSLSDEARKTLYAPDNASFLVLRGIVRRVNTVLGRVESRSVVYTIALGCNRSDDYNVYRNTCYTLHIKINGFSMNDVVVEGDDATVLNTSVHRIYNLAVAAPRITTMDCHYDKRYLRLTQAEDQAEVELFDMASISGTFTDAQGARQDVIVSNADGTFKIQHPLVNRTADAAGGNASHPDWAKLAALATTPGNDTEQGVANPRAVNAIDDIQGDGYHYNVDFDDATEHDFAVCTREHVGAAGAIATATRSAIVQIKHTYRGESSAVLATLSGDKDAGAYLVWDVDGDGGTGLRYEKNADGTFKLDADGQKIRLGSGDGLVDIYKFVEVKQYPPLQVAYNGQTLLVEQFEEYAWHLDPRYSSNEDRSTSGLPWGWQYISDSDYHDFSANTSQTNGLDNTNNIYSTTCTTHQAAKNRWLDYAARYCYHKNARNADGSVTYASTNWYMPALQELTAIESSISSISGVATTMTDKEYWSSTTPTDAEVKQTPDFSDWGFLEFIAKAFWQYFVGDRLNYSDDYGYYNVAKAAKNGVESKTTTSATYTIGWSKYTRDIAVYNNRLTSLHVRACRAAP